MRNSFITHQLEENMLSLHQDAGRAWLNDLPSIVDKLVDDFGLVTMVPVPNMTYHFVAKTIMNGQPAVLKIGLDREIMKDELNALTYFNGCGSVRCLKYHEVCNALLIEQAVPAYTLKSIYPNKLETVIDAYANVLSKLHRKNENAASGFRHVSVWLEAIRNGSSAGMPAKLLDKAQIEVRNLLNSVGNEVVLHGDLHHDNILLNENSWVAIDPKGIVGESEFDAAAFDFISDNELQSDLNLASIFNDRVKLLSEKAGLNTERLISWVYIRLVLSAVWFVEDNSEPDKPLRLIERLF